MPTFSLALALSLGSSVLCNGARVGLASPDRSVTFTLSVENGALTYSATFKNRSVIDASRLGIVVDGVNVTEGVSIGTVERYSVDEKYPWRGVHAEAVHKSRGARVAVRHTVSKTSYTLDLQAFMMVWPFDSSCLAATERSVHLMPQRTSQSPRAA